jgi:hypothetical protein
MKTVSSRISYLLYVVMQYRGKTNNAIPCSWKTNIVDPTARENCTDDGHFCRHGLGELWSNNNIRHQGWESRLSKHIVTVWFSSQSPYDSLIRFIYNHALWSCDGWLKKICLFLSINKDTVWVFPSTTDDLLTVRLLSVQSIWNI